MFNKHDLCNNKSCVPSGLALQVIIQTKSTTGCAGRWFLIVDFLPRLRWQSPMIFMLFKGLTPPAIHKFVFVNCLYPKFRWLYLLACISYICSDTTAFCTETTHVVAAFSRASESFSRWFAKTWISGLIFATKLVRAPGRLNVAMVAWVLVNSNRLKWGSNDAIVGQQTSPSFSGNTHIGPIFCSRPCCQVGQVEDYSVCTLLWFIPFAHETLVQCGPIQWGVLLNSIII